MKNNIKKDRKQSFYITLVVVATIGVLLLNIIFGLLGQRFSLEFDLTENKLFEISQQTKKSIAEMEQNIEIKVLAKEDTFVSTSTYNAQANEVIKQFDKSSDFITLAYIDYIKDPSFASRYPDLKMKHGDILVTSNGKNRLIPTQDLFNYVTGQNGKLAIASSKAEEALLSAILSVTNDEKPRIVVISGHSEYTMPDFIDLLQKNNYEPITQNLITETIKEDAKAALLLAPKEDLSGEELKKLDAFLYNNGEYGNILFYTADPGQKELPNLETFLSEWGIGIGEGSVFETDEKRVYNYQPFYGIVDYVYTDFSDMLLSDTVPLLAPISRPISALFEYRENYSAKVMTQFAKSSGVRPLDATETFTADQAEIKGPVTAMILSSYTKRDTSGQSAHKTSYVLASGSTAMLDKFAIGNSSFSNAEYLINAFNVLSNRKNVIKITPKTITGNSLNVSKNKADIIGAIFVFILPALVLAAGIVIWLKRRHK